VAETKSEQGKADGGLIIADLGSLSRKKIKQLRKGKGRAVEDLSEAINALKQNGTIAASAQVVVAVVKQKKAKLGLLGLP
jgi:hypothetical protein